MDVSIRLIMLDAALSLPGFISGNNLKRLPMHPDPPFPQPERFIAEHADLIEAMGTENDRAATIFEFHHPINALFLEIRITHRERLVHDQNVWIQRGD